MGKVVLRLIVGSSLLLLLGCGTQRGALKSFSDIQALESQVRNYRDWLQAKDQELSSLKKVLSPQLVRFLKSNLYYYETLNGQLGVMDSAYFTISTLAREQKRRILPLQERKTPSGKQSFSEIAVAFSSVDLEIHQHQEAYISARREIVALLKKSNLQLIFIPEQVLQWQETLLDLLEHRTRLRPRFEKLIDLAVGELSTGETDGSVRKLSEVLNTAEAYQKDLDRLETFFDQLETLAIREMNGSVYIRGIGSEPPEYEKRAIRGRVKYQSILAELERLLPEI